MSASVPTTEEFNALAARVTEIENSLPTSPPPTQPPPPTGNMPFIDARDFGLSESSDDNRAAVQNAVDAAFENKVGRVLLPMGFFKISDYIEVAGVALEGVGPVQSGLILTTAGKDLIHLPGSRSGVHVPGGRVAGLGLFIQAGLQGNSAVLLGQGDTNMPDRAELEGLRITTSGLPHGLWQRAIFCNATSRLSPPGCRGMTIRDVEVFNCTTPAVVLWGITNLRIESVNTFTGGGTQSMMGFWIGGNASVKCNDVQVSNCRTDGPINVTNTVDSGFEGRFYGGVQYDGSAVNCVFSTN